MENDSDNSTRADLEERLELAERRINELRQERDEARDLAQRQAEYVADHTAQTERWIEAFKMVLEDDGAWTWSKDFVIGVQWFQKYEALRKEWNRLVPKYNVVIVPKDVGR